MNSENEFTKIIDYQRSYAWRFWKRIRASRARREYQHYAYLEKIGVPCPGGRHYQEHRNRLGLLTHATLHMERLQHATDLRYMMCLNEYAELRNNHGFRRRLTRTIARWVRVMHKNGFYHLNLNFRNVMLDTEALAEPNVYFIDMTSGKINPPAIRRQYMLVKELAFLYKDARKWCAPQEMLTFYKTYMKQERLTDRDRRLIKEIQCYAQNKWGNRSSTIHD